MDIKKEEKYTEQVLKYTSITFLIMFIIVAIFLFFFIKDDNRANNLCKEYMEENENLVSYVSYEKHEDRQGEQNKILCKYYNKNNNKENIVLDRS